MYRDKDKQREAVKHATRRYRQRLKGITKVSQEQGITQEAVIPAVIPMIEDVAANGGEYSFTTVKGEVRDVHHVKPQSHNPMMVGYEPKLCQELTVAKLVECVKQMDEAGIEG